MRDLTTLDGHSMQFEIDHARLITSQLLDYRPLDWDIGKL